MSKIMLKSSGTHQKGIFAAEPIKKGEQIISFGGALLHRSKVDFDDYHLQISPDLYLGPSGGLDDYINHSCAPNACFQDGLNLVALNDIAINDEITWDYSTAIDEADFEGFPCSCAAATCRGIVTSFRHLSQKDKLRLFPNLLPYLKIQYGIIKEEA